MRNISLKRVVWGLLGGTLLLALESCATEPAKPSPTAIQIDQIRQALQGITESYEKKDEKAFFEKLDPAFKNGADFKSQTLQDFKAFSQIEVHLTIDRAQIEAQAVWVAAHWGGVWKTAAEAPPIEKKGHALFKWTSGDPPKLLEIRGDPPFGVFRPGT